MREYSKLKTGEQQENKKDLLKYKNETETLKIAPYQRFA